MVAWQVLCWKDLFRGEMARGAVFLIHLLSTDTDQNCDSGAGDVIGRSISRVIMRGWSLHRTTAGKSYD